MEFSFDVGLWGWLILIVGAVVLGIIAQLIGIGAFVGAFAASEFITGWRTYEPVFDKLALIPALIGGIVVGIVVAVATRFLTGGRYLGEAT
jgi:uncharacterized membrane protein YeaQ/YmgE (transglycosylase-associated protein family)